jgi:protein-tyrosine phosphatase
MLILPAAARPAAEVGVERHLDWPDLLNARDLGGYRCADGVETRWRAVVRADNLNKLGPEGGRAMVDYGVRTVLDLRDPRELEKFPNPLAAAPPAGVTFVNVPLISDAEWAAMREPGHVSEGYVQMLKLSHANLSAAVGAVADAPAGGVVIHCHAGKERTGVLAALLLALCEVPDELIAEDWAASDLYLQPLYAEWLSAVEDPALRAKRADGFRTEPQHILDVLAYVRKFGGVVPYLVAGGAGLDQLMRVRQRLR